MGSIVAEFITTGILNANLIKTGIIQSLNGESFINLDTGEAQLTGTLKSYNGEQYVSLDSGGITFQDYHRNEQMLRVGLSYFNSNRDMNGVNFALAQCGDFIRFSHIAKDDITNGWSPSDTQYNFMDFWSSDQTVGGISYKKGINVYSPMFVNNGIQLFSGTNYPSEILGDVSWDNGLGTIWNMLGLYGDNGSVLGYKNGSSLNARIVVTEGSHPGTNDQIKSWGNWNLSGYTIHNGTFSGTFVNTYANTETNTMAEVGALETDCNDNIRYIYKNITSVNNKIILNVPNEYAGREYTIVGVAKKSFGDYAITLEEEKRFIIETDREMTLNIEISIV